MRRNSSNPALLLLIALGLAVLTQSPAQRETSTDVLLLQSQAEADRKSAGLHDLPHRHRQRHHAQHRHRAPGMHRLSRRQFRNPSDRRRAERFSAIRSSQTAKLILNRGIRRTPAASANPTRAYTQWLREDWNYIRFVNPGDLRVAEKTCGTSGCHTAEVRKVQTSMMTHGAMLWGAALYNNGAFPLKTPRFGESYGPDGTPQRLLTFPPPTPEEISKKGILPYLDPLQRWEISQPGNVLRVFERGSKKKPEVGNPSLEEDPGKPEIKLSERGFGTELRTDPVFLGLQKTRLLDPLLSFPGTNDQPGDYRASGCSACHVVYANDRSPEHSGAYAAVGNLGQTATADPTIPRNQSGHPIRHQFTRSIPSSQCMVCHMHPGTNMVATYFGYTWWDNEMDGEHMWPAAAAQSERCRAEPDSDAQSRTLRRPRPVVRRRTSWRKPARPSSTSNCNTPSSPTSTATAGSSARVSSTIAKATCSTQDDKTVSFDDPDKFGKAVHLKDIHLEKGMHCIDCHFEQDSHGNGKLYGETRNAIEIDCVDCHGTIQQRATLITSGTAAPKGGTNLARLRTPWQERRFYWKDDRLYQRSMLEKDKEWEVVQVLDTITPGSAALQREITPGQNHSAGRPNLGRRPGEGFACRIKARTSQQQDDLLHLPLLLGAHLLRLPSFDDGEPAHAHAAQRRPHHAQLDFLQFSGPARRHLHAGNRRHGNRQSRGAGTISLRGAGQFAK